LLGLFGCVHDDPIGEALGCEKSVGSMTMREIEVCEGLVHSRRVVSEARDTLRGAATELMDANRKAAIPHHDPGAIELCPKPRRMTNDGCQ
jgi:hypothetical protein